MLAGAWGAGHCLHPKDGPQLKLPVLEPNTCLGGGKGPGGAARQPQPSLSVYKMFCVLRKRRKNEQWCLDFLPQAVGGSQKFLSRSSMNVCG